MQSLFRDRPPALDPSSTSRPRRATEILLFLFRQHSSLCGPPWPRCELYLGIDRGETCKAYLAIDQHLYLILLATCCPCNETLATLHEAITALDNPTELNINLAIYAKVRAAQIKSTPIKLTPVSNTPLFKTPLLNIPSYIITVASLVFAINLLT